jgi:transmembrane sensor
MKKTLKQKTFKMLVSKYLLGKGTDIERRYVERYYDLFDTKEDILREQDHEVVQDIGRRLKLEIDKNIKSQETRPYKLFRRFTVAALILFTGSASFYFYSWQKDAMQIAVRQNKLAKQDLSPGSNRAILELSDGSEIVLNDSHSGIVAHQKGIAITKTEASLQYDRAVPSKAVLVFNSVSTPRGGQYQLRLSDGTAVWLNAGSKLTYPVAFGGNEREVSLSGEAYFEVAKDAMRPFRVNTNQQRVTVIGTHFNISAYTDDKETKTTLLEGRVSVQSLNSLGQRILKPGEQAQTFMDNKQPRFVIYKVDNTEAVAWKNGYFQFRDEGLESILKKIARWYDVEIDYAENWVPSGLYYNGTVSKYKNASQVLKKLELSGGVRFQIEGRRIMVMPQ